MWEEIPEEVKGGDRGGNNKCEERIDVQP